MFFASRFGGSRARLSLKGRSDTELLQVSEGKRICGIVT